MPAMCRVLDFFELRPVFTLRLIQVLWWLYIVDKLYGTHWGLMRTITARGPTPPLYNWLDLFFTPLRVLIALATVRLLLDVLLAYLMPDTRRRMHNPALTNDLWAFLDLRPFFTPWWLRVFWWLFLLSVLRAAYPSLVFSPPWAYAASPADWFNFFRVLLGQLLWIGGVRLLIEVALALHHPGQAAPETTTPSS